MFSLSTLIVPFVLGGMIGWVYFSGLWETVRRLPEAKSPHRLMILSFAARTLFALGGFFILTDGQWERMAASVAGFFIVKAVLVGSLGRIPRSFSTGACSWKS
ncbi:MAG: ATP synthase subunit I [Deltaproteobacteria bacterium HGW-Deltaproteobacteria-11]|nr:MAG: ATP synthase subunit I [Deltaproteobacteria bacterium HGW-Deltaproteobacteria-11]